MRRFMFGLFALAGLCTSAAAGLIPAAVNVTPDGDNYRYSYTIQLPSDYKITEGDFFTVYDFHGFTGGGAVTQPLGWTFTSDMLGPNPPRILPYDSDEIPNLTWTYSGPDVEGGKILGVFEAVSSIGPMLMDADFASQDHRLIDGRAVGNYTFTSAPDVAFAGTPEPATLALAGLGLPLVLLRRWRRAG